jgi:hypothetical protein
MLLHVGSQILKQHHTLCHLQRIQFYPPIQQIACLPPSVHKIFIENEYLSGIAIRVPEITRGNPLKTRKKAKHELTHEPKTRARHDHDPGGPRGPPGWHGGCPLGRGPPHSRVKRSLGQGLPRSRAQRPLGRGPPRSRAKRPLGRGPPHSRDNAPSARTASLEGTCTHVVPAPTPVYGHLVL